MLNEHMQLIIRREKNHEFRRYHLPDTVARIWFYLSAPFSHIAYVCEVLPARGRGPEDDPLLGDGVGNKEFNERHEDWEKYNYAYPVQSVYKLATPISLRELKETYGMKGAPRSAVYAPETLLLAVRWHDQECVWSAKTTPMPASVQGNTEKTRPTKKRLTNESDLASSLGENRKRQASCFRTLIVPALSVLSCRGSLNVPHLGHDAPDSGHRTFLLTGSCGCEGDH